MKKLELKNMKMWYLWLLLLIVSNAAYLPKNFIGWFITLLFFLFVPGYLLLNCLKHEIKSRWEIASFSLGLSLLLMMVGGLLLNSFHALGLSRPLSTSYVFSMLDIITLTLLIFNRKQKLYLPNVKLHPKKESVAMISSLTVLPLLAIGGAIRLNNGASDILTMILFAAIPILFLLLLWRNRLKPIYPYAIFMIGLSVLFSTSLRGWYITGHDIHHEFIVFQTASRNGFWISKTSHGDPYNACLSITILPTIIDKITAISAPYVFKVVFQMIFAFGLIPIYYFIRRLARNTKSAFMGSFIFISFPTFLNDMPFLNRQEIAFVFFGLLLLTVYLKMAYKTKTILTILCLLGIILSHYSSGYVTLAVLLLAWFFYKILTFKYSKSNTQILPLLSLPIIILALLFTFLWNSQITSSTANLRQTITQTFSGLVHGSSIKGSLTNYGLFASTSTTPAQEFASYVSKEAGQVKYAAPLDLAVTRLGNNVSRVLNVESLNNGIHTSTAKIFQVLVILGALIFYLRLRKKSNQKNAYYFALILASLFLLVLLTVLPEISVDYTVTRLFQQCLIILALPIIVAAEILLSFLGRYKMYAVAIFFALLFLDLSGFVPQILGGFLPQLSLNNSGIYYDFFYTHKSDVVANQWLAANRNKRLPIYMDTNASAPILSYPVQVGFLGKAADSGYLYQDYTNTTRGIYRTFINGGFIEYSFPGVVSNRNLLYANQYSRVYSKMK